MALVTSRPWAGPTASSSYPPDRTPMPKDLSPACTGGNYQGVMTPSGSPTTTVVPLSRLQHPRDQLGRPMHDLRISVMDRCNFRCPYCMPKEQFHEKYQFMRT